ncbi:MAG: hypothetical protein JSS57_04420 [Proteobacteria bacterium]|nr:hypothetical protein [Pseudomonadota bacterium]
MDADLSRKVIDVAGGCIAFARLLKIDESPRVSQRVNNWRRRGIPAQVIVDNIDLIRGLIKDAELTSD